MTQEISTDAELISRLLTTQPTPAECLVAAARIEQLAAALAASEARVAKLVEALKRWEHSGCPDCGGDCASANPPVSLCIMRETRAAIMEASQ